MIAKSVHETFILQDSQLGEDSCLGRIQRGGVGLARQLFASLAAEEIADALGIGARRMRQSIQQLLRLQQALGLQVLEDLDDLGAQWDVEALRAQGLDLFRQVGVHLVSQAGTTEHGGAAAVVLAIHKHRVAQCRGVMHQVPMGVEQARTAVDAQQGMSTDVIEHVDQVAAHRAGKTGGFLGGLFGVFKRSTLAQLPAGFVQRAAGLLQPWRDAAQHDSSTHIDVVEGRIEGLQAAFR